MPDPDPIPPRPHPRWTWIDTVFFGPNFGPLTPILVAIPPIALFIAMWLLEQLYNAAFAASIHITDGLGSLILLVVPVGAVWGLSRQLAANHYQSILKSITPGRCAHCGYALDSTMPRCPECGRTPLAIASEASWWISQLRQRPVPRPEPGLAPHPDDSQPPIPPPRWTWFDTLHFGPDWGHRTPLIVFSALLGLCMATALIIGAVVPALGSRITLSPARDVLLIRCIIALHLVPIAWQFLRSAVRGHYRSLIRAASGGACARCGYADVASLGRCPECGATPHQSLQHAAWWLKRL